MTVHGQQHITRAYRPCMRTISNTVLLRANRANKIALLINTYCQLQTQVTQKLRQKSKIRPR